MSPIKTRRARNWSPSESLTVLKIRSYRKNSLLCSILGNTCKLATEIPPPSKPRTSPSSISKNGPNQSKPSCSASITNLSRSTSTTKARSCSIPKRTSSFIPVARAKINKSLTSTRLTSKNIHKSAEGTRLSMQNGARQGDAEETDQPQPYLDPKRAAIDSLAPSQLIFSSY